MASTQHDTIAELQRANAELRRERDAVLAQRDSDHDERIAHQAATVEVLKAMSASPGDAQPVFDLICRQARSLLDVIAVALFEYDGTLVHFRALDGGYATANTEAHAAYVRAWPRVPDRGSLTCRAILDGTMVHVRDLSAEPEISQAVRGLGHRTQVSIPLLRDGRAIGALTTSSPLVDGVTDAQIELLRTFAEQATIAITSAETYRALQTRTADLQESLEYQTATSDVLKVISRSTFDLQPVLDTLVETAARLCKADMASMSQREGDLYRFATEYGYPPEYRAWRIALGAYVPDANTIGSRAVLAGHPVHIHDVAAEPGYATGAITLGKQRTSLGVPLMRNGEPIGNFVLARQRVEPFTDQQIDLVSTFADQAVIAIENARLLTEQREALEQQTATAEVLQVINASPGDLAPVFQTMLDRALRLCGAAFGELCRIDGEITTTVAVSGMPAAFSQVRVGSQVRPGPGTTPWRFRHGENLVHIADLVDTEAYRDGDPLRRALVDDGGARALLAVPLRKDDALLGLISIYRQEPGAFTDKQIALLENFAAQAVIAMDNTRLLTETREALEQQTATAEVLGVINRSPGDLTPVFDAVLEKALRLCGGTIGGIFTIEGSRSVTRALQGVTPAFAAFQEQYPIDEIEPDTVPARIIDTRRPVQNPDVKGGEAYRNGFTYARALVDLGNIHAVLAVPLFKDGVVVGMIALYREQPGTFADKQVALLENFAAQAVIAMENARLLTEQQEALEQQTATAEVLQAINTSPGNLAPVFEAILEKAHKICRFDHGALALFDGTHFRSVATRGFGETGDAFTRVPYRPSGAQRLVLRGARYGHIPDISAFAAEPDDTVFADFIALTGFRATLLVPLRKDGVVIGHISGWRLEAGPFSDKEIALLENFAAQAVIAMENTRLLNEQREELERQTAFADVLQTINASGGNLTPVFDAILENAMRLCQTQVGTFWLIDDGKVRIGAARGWPPAAAERYARPVRASVDTIIGRIAYGGEAMHIADLKETDAYHAGDPIRRVTVDEVGIRTLYGVPLIKDGTALGALLVGRTEVRSLTDKEMAILRDFANQAVIAIDNAHLLNQIRQRQEELRITFENMGDGVALFDETPRLVAWNRKFQDILDLPDGVLAERLTFAEYIRYLTGRGEFGAGADPEEQIRRLVENIDRYRSFERVRPDGRVVEVRHNPVPAGGFVLIYADITERKRNEAEIRAARDAAETASRTIEAAYRDLKAAQANLIQAEKMASLGQLTAGIAHEIKNPLNFVNNFADLSVDLVGELQEAVARHRQDEIDELSGTLKGNLQKIAEHGRRADGIVRSMLEHSRGSSSERRKVDLNALIDEALNLAYHGARAQDQTFNIILERDFGGGIAPIELAPQDITRVLLNLFSNGFYASTERVRNGAHTGFEPTLKVSTRAAAGAVEIRVRDNGAGIPDDIRDKLFQPFFTTKPTGEGTGLGLSISYDIVTQQHGGSITVDSKVGEYSEFTVRLPLNR